jgi:opacity protein-like surface antigen
MFIFCSNDLFARAVGLKIIYNNMMGDYSDAELENNISGGLFFEVGTFGFQSLIFRPGLDFVNLETKDFDIATIWGFHCDWYWYFMEKGALAPFLGFGPALNYIRYEDNHNGNGGVGEDDDSDVGIEGFGGVEYAVSGQIKLMLELRFVIHDIADTDKQIFKPSIGASYSF